MCLLVIAVGEHPDLPLIVAANRDEFHDRPTQDAHWWPDRLDVLGGRDLQAGGTWLAISRDGRFAAVTNYRDARHESANLLSRGQLVTEFLASNETPLDYLRRIDGARYAGFNLLVADRDSVAYLSNRGAPMRELDRGIYGLSNATLDDPWSKVTRSKAKLASLIAGGHVNETTLMRMLDDRNKAAAHEVEANGLSFETAHSLTAPFIVMPDYGTRCSTILTINDSGNAQFMERRFDPTGRSIGESRFVFDVLRED